MAEIDQFYYQESSKFHDFWLACKSLAYVPWHESTEENDLVATFFANLDNFVTNMSVNQRTKLHKFGKYLKKQYFDHKLWGYRRGHHYLFYKNYSSDLTSNIVESQNWTQNCEHTPGKKSICDVCHFLLWRKQMAYCEKLYATHDDQFTLRRKKVRDW